MPAEVVQAEQKINFVVSQDCEAARQHCPFRHLEISDMHPSQDACLSDTSGNSLKTCVDQVYQAAISGALLADDGLLGSRINQGSDWSIVYLYVYVQHLNFAIELWVVFLSSLKVTINVLSLNVILNLSLLTDFALREFTHDVWAFRR